jgi:CheY-like chemotaxis protein/transcriptional regulator with XRE-family HTH domain
MASIVEIESAKAKFEAHLRRTLTGLYDPTVLRNNPLTQLLVVEPRGNAGSALQRTLLSAIESVRPHGSIPPGSQDWRIYQILRYRYTEQISQREVAINLGLSIRHLQRLEKLAREVLTDYLWVAHNLETEISARAATVLPALFADDGEPASSAEASIPTHAQELEWLSNSAPAQMIRVGVVIQEVLKSIGPLLQSARVSVSVAVQEEDPEVLLQAPILRQILVNVVSTAIHYTPGGHAHIESEVLPQQVIIQVSATAHTATASAQKHQYPDSLLMTRQLLRLCQGFLVITSEGDQVFAAKIGLPLRKQATVLVVDDNADTLHLLRRYLSGSHYRFVGAQDAEQGLALAEELVPQIIVVDVMMLEQDGWTLLSQLREHPKTFGIPVIVCTILAHKELALTLGAADFIRKPVHRADFLGALDRQLDRSPKGSW